MNKILLVYEDYADLMAVEATLKKVGFDVLGLTSEYSVSEQMLAFNPDLVVASGRGGKVSSLSVGKRLKEMTRWQGKSVLIFPANFKPDPQDLIRIRVDMILEAPVSPLRLVQVLGKILGHDEAVLLERLNKAMHVESPARSSSSASGAGKFTPEGEAIFVKGNVEGSTESSNVEGSDAALGSERVQEDSQEFPLSSENEGRKLSFKFGDRLSESHASSPEGEASPAEEMAFPDVDLKALERELLGGGAPEVERVEVSTPLISAEPTVEEPASEEPTSKEIEKARKAAADEALFGPLEEDEQNIPEEPVVVASNLSPEEIQAKTQDSLRNAQAHVSEKVAKYAEMVADMKLSPKSTLTRVETRRRQKQLAAEWDVENTKELDELRREFTKALFKK